MPPTPPLGAWEHASALTVVYALEADRLEDDPAMAEFTRRWNLAAQAHNQLVADTLPATSEAAVRAERDIDAAVDLLAAMLLIWQLGLLATAEVELPVPATAAVRDRIVAAILEDRVADQSRPENQARSLLSRSVLIALDETTVDPNGLWSELRSFAGSSHPTLLPDMIGAVSECVAELQFDLPVDTGISAQIWHSRPLQAVIDMVPATVIDGMPTSMSMLVPRVSYPPAAPVGSIVTALLDAAHPDHDRVQAEHDLRWREVRDTLTRQPEHDSPMREQALATGVNLLASYLMVWQLYTLHHARDLHPVATEDDPRRVSRQALAAIADRVHTGIDRTPHGQARVLLAEWTETSWGDAAATLAVLQQQVGVIDPPTVQAMVELCRDALEQAGGQRVLAERIAGRWTIPTANLTLNRITDLVTIVDAPLSESIPSTPRSVEWEHASAMTVVCALDLDWPEASLVWAEYYRRWDLAAQAHRQLATDAPPATSEAAMRAERDIDAAADLLGAMLAIWQAGLLKAAEVELPVPVPATAAVRDRIVSTAFEDRVADPSVPFNRARSLLSRWVLAALDETTLDLDGLWGELRRFVGTPQPALLRELGEVVYDRLAGLQFGPSPDAPIPEQAWHSRPLQVVIDMVPATVTDGVPTPVSAVVPRVSYPPAAPVSVIVAALLDPAHPDHDRVQPEHDVRWREVHREVHDAIVRGAVYDPTFREDALATGVALLASYLMVWQLYTLHHATSSGPALAHRGALLVPRQALGRVAAYDLNVTDRATPHGQARALLTEWTSISWSDEAATRAALQQQVEVIDPETVQAMVEICRDALAQAGGLRVLAERIAGRWTIPTANLALNRITDLVVVVDAPLAEPDLSTPRLGVPQAASALTLVCAALSGDHPDRPAAVAEFDRRWSLAADGHRQASTDLFTHRDDARDLLPPLSGPVADYDQAADILASFVLIWQLWALQRAGLDVPAPASATARDALVAVALEDQAVDESFPQQRARSILARWAIEAHRPNAMDPDRGLLSHLRRLGGTVDLELMQAMVALVREVLADLEPAWAPVTVVPEQSWQLRPLLVIPLMLPPRVTDGEPTPNAEILPRVTYPGEAFMLPLVCAALDPTHPDNLDARVELDLRWREAASAVDGTLDADQQHLVQALTDGEDLLASYLALWQLHTLHRAHELHPVATEDAPLRVSRQALAAVADRDRALGDRTTPEGWARTLLADWTETAWSDPGTTHEDLQRQVGAMSAQTVRALLAHCGEALEQTPEPWGLTAILAGQWTIRPIDLALDRTLEIVTVVDAALPESQLRTPRLGDPYHAAALTVVCAVLDPAHPDHAGAVAEHETRWRGAVAAVGRLFDGEPEPGDPRLFAAAEDLLATYVVVWHLHTMQRAVALRPIEGTGTARRTVSYQAIRTVIEQDRAAQDTTTPEGFVRAQLTYWTEQVFDGRVVESDLAAYVRTDLVGGLNEVDAFVQVCQQITAQLQPPWTLSHWAAENWHRPAPDLFSDRIDSQIEIVSAPVPGFAPALPQVGTPDIAPDLAVVWAAVDAGQPDHAPAAEELLHRMASARTAPATAQAGGVTDALGSGTRLLAGLVLTWQLGLLHRAGFTTTVDPLLDGNENRDWLTPLLLEDALGKDPIRARIRAHLNSLAVWANRGPIEHAQFTAYLRTQPRELSADDAAAMLGECQQVVAGMPAGLRMEKLLDPEPWSADPLRLLQWLELLPSDRQRERVYDPYAPPVPRVTYVRDAPAATLVWAVLDRDHPDHDRALVEHHARWEAFRTRAAEPDAKTSAEHSATVDLLATYLAVWELLTLHQATAAAPPAPGDRPAVSRRMVEAVLSGPQVQVVAEPDVPVDQVRALLQRWTAELPDRPDMVRTQVELRASTLTADEVDALVLLCQQAVEQTPRPTGLAGDHALWTRDLLDLAVTGIWEQKARLVDPASDAVSASALAALQHGARDLVAGPAQLGHDLAANSGGEEPAPDEVPLELDPDIDPRP